VTIFTYYSLAPSRKEKRPRSKATFELDSPSHEYKKNDSQKHKKGSPFLLFFFLIIKQLFEKKVKLSNGKLEIEEETLKRWTQVIAFFSFLYFENKKSIKTGWRRGI
jgi:hypothetical protein